MDSLEPLAAPAAKREPGALLKRLVAVALLVLGGCYDLGSLSDKFVGDAAVGDLAAEDGDLGTSDLAGADLSGLDLGANPDLAGSRVIFLLTPDRYGNVLAAAGGIGPLDGQCTTAANSAGLSGSYVALIADSALGATRGLTFTTARPIVLPSGALVSDGLLFSAAIYHAINEQANGTPPAGNATCVWTGFDSSGASVSFNCADWTIGAGTPNYQGAIGDTRVASSNWAHATDVVCNVATCFVYCLQQ